MDALKTLDIIDGVARDVATLYIAHCKAVIGLLNSAQLSPINELTVKQFRKNAIESSNEFSALIDRLIDAGVAQITESLDGNKKLTGVYLKDSAKYSKLQIAQQMQSDINMVRVDLFRFVMTVKNGERISKSQVSAVIAAKKSVKLVNTDRIGRRKNAQLFIASVIRMWAVSAIYDAALSKAAISKSGKMKLSNGEVVDVVDYHRDVQLKYVHPNTKVLPIQ